MTLTEQILMLASQRIAPELQDQEANKKMSWLLELHGQSGLHCRRCSDVSGRELGRTLGDGHSAAALINWIPSPDAKLTAYVMTDQPRSSDVLMAKVSHSDEDVVIGPWQHTVD